jgi:hypothetical protein
MLLALLFPLETEKPLLRLGPMGDGGYLVPDDLGRLRAVFSPGVSTESGFELDCARLGLDVFLADGSVERPSLQHERFHFRRSFLGPYSAPGIVTLEEWVAAEWPEPRGDLLLQMDIEGDEYVVFLTTPEAVLRRFRIMVVEFHYLHLLPTLQFFRLAAPVFRRLLTTHACVHIHPNSHCGFVEQDGLRLPRMMEFTFLRRDRARVARYATTFPHPLDCANDAGRDLPLPACWHSATPDEIRMDAPTPWP